MFENSMWLLVVAGGPLVIAFALAYALLNQRHRGPAERRESAEATNRVYEKNAD